MLSKKTYEEGDRSFHPDGLNSTQNAAVGIARTLKSGATRPDVVKAIPVVSAAISSTNPKLTLDEAKEIWQILDQLCSGYSGNLEMELSNLLRALEDLFPEEVFK